MRWAWARPELAAVALFLAVYLSWLALDWIPGGERDLRILFLVPIDALAIYAAWRAAGRCAATPRLRRVWLLVALAWTVQLLADLCLVLYDIVLDDPTFPSVADLFFIAFYPLMLLALVGIPAPPAPRSQRLRIALDCATVVVGAGAAVWYFVLGPTVTEGGQAVLATAVSIAYPVGGLVLLGALSFALMRQGPPTLRLPLRLIAVGLLLLIVADAVYGHDQLRGAYSPGDPVDTLYVLLVVPFVLAAAAQRRTGPHDEAPEAAGPAEPAQQASRLPLVALVLGFGVLLGTQWQDTFFPDLSLLISSIALAALVVARQYAAQHELIQLQERLSTIVESVAEGIVTFDERGEIIWVNPAAETFFGAEPGSLPGRCVDALFEGVTWSEMAPMVGVGGMAGPVIGKHLKFTGRRGNGAVFPAEIVVTEARLDNERIMIAIGQDVSERLRAERALKESEQRFRGIFDNAGVGIVFSAFDGSRVGIVDANPTFLAMVGYSVEELRGDDFSLITPAGDRDDLAEIGAAVEAGRDRIVREQRCQRKDGSYLWVSLTISILRDDAGTPHFAIGMLEDITRRKEAERVKDEFVSVVGHELRTPLTSIRGSLGLLEGGVMGDMPREAEHMLATAVSNTDRLVRLINDILDVERIDSGTAPMATAPVAAADLVAQSAQALQGVADEAGVTVAAAVAELTVDAAADRIVQALVNLIGNAIKFSPPDGVVTVEVERQGDRALFSVGDRGRGIPPAKLEAVFERFSQVDSSDAREKGGTGLGLSIARGIVEHHGGRIWAESEEGSGATLRFTLPLAAAGAVPHPEAERGAR